MPFSIVSYDFSRPVRESAEPHHLLSDHVQGTNWPVVYLIHGNNEIYIGETNNASERINQHLDPKGTFYEKRQKLEKVEIVFDSWFNKSAILDIENALIGLFRYEILQTKDENKRSKFFTRLQNGNRGQSKLHNYYNRAHYQEEVENIWEELRKRSIATNKYSDIVNDVLFKYSPYTALNEEQQNISIEILNGIMDSLEAMREGRTTGYTAVVSGEAGTGKTIVLINMLVRIVEAMNSNQTNIDCDNDDLFESALELGELSQESKLINRIKSYVQKYGSLRFAYVAQMSSLRNTMGRIFKDVPHMHKKDSKGPNDIVNEAISGDNGDIEPFDILFVDEAHRLWQYDNIGSARGAYKKACERIYGKDVDPKSVTALDWLIRCSRTRVLVYDPFQTVKDSDITPQQFLDAVYSDESPHYYKLHQQMRCRAGMDYVSFINSLFEDNQTKTLQLYPDHYDFRFFENANDLINEIIKRNAESGLSRCATGYGWQWNRNQYENCKRKYLEWINKSGETDTRKKQLFFYLNHLAVEDGLIVFDGSKYVRNLDYDWILRGEPQEIGCIHTSQGYDLNYVGVLLGPEIDYSPEKGVFVIPERINDKSVSSNLAGMSSEERKIKYEEIKTYVINAYKVMLERGIKGCYVYAHNEGLREHLKRVLNEK